MALYNLNPLVLFEQESLDDLEEFTEDLEEFTPATLNKAGTTMGKAMMGAAKYHANNQRKSASNMFGKAAINM